MLSFFFFFVLEFLCVDIWLHFDICLSRKKIGGIQGFHGFCADDVDATLGSLVRAGAILDEESIEGGLIHSAAVLDPFGVLWCIHDKPRGVKGFLINLLDFF